MIGFLRGRVAATTADAALLDVGGIGYRIFMPLGDLEQIATEPREVTVHTHMQVREDAIQLFGFLSTDDLELFRMLIGVSGVGPKGAVNILTQIPGNEFRLAVLSGDAPSIAKAQGIGKKTAEKIIVELKDKLHLEDTLEGFADDTVVSGENGATQDAIEALIALGYSASESLRAVRQVADASSLTTEEVISRALLEM